MSEGIKTRRGKSHGKMDSNTYLYNLGDECINITGGIKQGVLFVYAGGTCTFTKKTSYIQIDASGKNGYASSTAPQTVNKINLSGYTKLKLDFSMISTTIPNSTYIYVYLTSTDSSADMDANTLIYVSAYPGNAGIVELNISALNSSYYCAVLCGSGGPYSSFHSESFSINKLWLE